jgi:crossover junction endodeoxyribonuclease RusA
MVEPTFPMEFVVPGTPVSMQGRSESKLEWTERIRRATLLVLPEGHFATARPIFATLFYFPATTMRGDLDNIVKPILDALSRHVYIDDAQVERIVVQKFERGNVFAFETPTAGLKNALNHVTPVLYVRISTDPFEELS